MVAVTVAPETVDVGDHIAVTTRYTDHNKTINATVDSIGSYGKTRVWYTESRTEIGRYVIGAPLNKQPHVTMINRYVPVQPTLFSNIPNSVRERAC